MNASDTRNKSDAKVRMLHMGADTCPRITMSTKVSFNRNSWCDLSQPKERR
jgi:hypothetical protein